MPDNIVPIIKDRKQYELLSEVEKGDLVYFYNSAVKDGIKQIKFKFLELGQYFYEIDLLKLLPDMGYATVGDFCNDPEVDISESSFYSLAHIHRVYELQHNIDRHLLAACGRKKLDYMAKMINGVNKDELISRASTLTYDDLRQSLGKEAPLEGSYQPTLEPGLYTLERVDNVDISTQPKVLGNINATLIRTNVGVMMKVK